MPNLQPITIQNWYCAGNYSLRRGPAGSAIEVDVFQDKINGMRYSALALYDHEEDRVDCLYLRQHDPKTGKQTKQIVLRRIGAMTARRILNNLTPVWKTLLEHIKGDDDV